LPHPIQPPSYAKVPAATQEIGIAEGQRPAFWTAGVVSQCAAMP
jgi:hypothetical protein